MDATNGLITLQKLKPALKSASLIAAAPGVDVTKVERLLRLAAAPEVVKNGSPDDDSGPEQTRTLDLFSALEFIQLYQAILKKGDNAQNRKKMAEARTGPAIARALKEDWGHRDVKQFVDKAISQPDKPTPKKGGRPAEPFKNTERDLNVHKDRLGRSPRLQHACAHR